MNESSRFLKEFAQIPEGKNNFERIYPDKTSVAGEVYEQVQKMFDGNLEELVVFSDKIGGDTEETRQLEKSDNKGRESSIKEIKETALTSKKDTPGRLYVPLMVRPDHHRAAELPLDEPVVDQRREIYGEKVYPSTNVYNVLNVKGPGYLFPEGYESKKESYYGSPNQPTVVTKPSDEEFEWGYNVLGMFDERVFEGLRKNTELMIRLGGRVENILAAYELKVCYFEGALKTIKELKEQGVLPEDKDDEEFVPLQVFRLQRNNSRIKDFINAGREQKETLLEDAFEELSLEHQMLKNELLNVKNEDEKATIEKQLERTSDSYSTKEIGQYLADTSYWVGRNLGIMQSLGRVMGYFNSGNVTLGVGELLDLDSIEVLKAKQHVNVEESSAVNNKTGDEYYYRIPPVLLKDIRDSLHTLRRFAIALKRTFDFNKKQVRSSMKESFLEGQLEGFQASKALEKMKFKNLDLANVKIAVNDLAERILVKNERIKPILLNK